MKKGLTIILLLFYFLSVPGIGLKEIYCCGKLKSVVIAVSVNEKTNCTKDHDHTKCCETKYHWLKIADNYLSSIKSPISLKPIIELFPFAVLGQLHFLFF